MLRSVAEIKVMLKRCQRSVNTPSSETKRRLAKIAPPSFRSLKNLRWLLSLGVVLLLQGQAPAGGQTLRQKVNFAALVP